MSVGCSGSIYGAVVAARSRQPDCRQHRHIDHCQSGINMRVLKCATRTSSRMSRCRGWALSSFFPSGKTFEPSLCQLCGCANNDPPVLHPIGDKAGHAAPEMIANLVELAWATVEPHPIHQRPFGRLQALANAGLLYSGSTEFKREPAFRKVPRPSNGRFGKISPRASVSATWMPVVTYRPKLVSAIPGASTTCRHMGVGYRSSWTAK